MLIFIDTKGADLFRPTTQDGGRHYYAAAPPFLAIIRCDDMDLPAARGRVVDANVGWDRGTPGFVREENEGRQHTKVTIRRVMAAGRAHSKTLSQVLAGAPREDTGIVKRSWSGFVECDQAGNYTDPVSEYLAQAFDLCARESDNNNSGIIAVQTEDGTRYFRRER